MPKVVTSRRLPVYTNKGQKEDDRFNAFHCKRCRTHLVTTDADLANIPRRRTDGAMVLDARLQVISLYTVKREGSRVIRREKGAERQYVHACPSCDQDVGYTSKPHEADLELVYLSDTAVTVPWHRMKSPFTCKVCGYICQSQGQLEFHRKQKQHTEDMEKEQEVRPHSLDTACTVFPGPQQAPHHPHDHATSSRYGAEHERHCGGRFRKDAITHDSHPKDSAGPA
ncbi:unnamed protein product [Symbiodinium sp. CCMP2592]|nr:unnamed protein product [Symbiodinium sp. CCMP2592]